MNKRLILILAILLLAFSACSSEKRVEYFDGTKFDFEDDDYKQVIVEINNNKYDPQTITVSEDTRIVWVNKDKVSHTVTSEIGLADSGIIKPGGRVSYAFDEEGEYDYYCLIHKEEKGKVIVTKEEDD
jgi:plastocyanin